LNRFFTTFAGCGTKQTNKLHTTDILLITPPFTQLNTAYPATVQLKGFLELKGMAVAQADLSIKTILKIFSGKGLLNIFDSAQDKIEQASPNSKRIYRLQKDYVRLIDPVISFLQGKNSTFAFSIVNRQVLPEASRFNQIEDLEWSFGNLGIIDQAKYLCTLFLEDLGDFISEVIDDNFGFSRYAERIALSAGSFDDLYEASHHSTIISKWMINCLELQIEKHKPKSIAVSIPFPGNLLSALQIAKHIKAKHRLPVIFGGGYINTELRTFSDKRIFEFADFICLDDGEQPVLSIIEHLQGKRTDDKLCRTFVLKDGEIVFINNDQTKVSHSEIGAPSYKGIEPSEYISTLEVLNPMHRLWSDGWWNKLMLAHGCYWQQCSFCDTSLDYIKRISKTPASELCDRIESVIAQTGQTGFHFVDEAAPPAVLRDLALEILKRNIHINWWGNIRFEKSFSADLCRLLAESGCIGVSGGLEVASDRLLKLINKGVSIEQVAQVCNNFTEAGILTHAYLMYGFPTQNEQETVDSLEIVRQLFEAGIVHSAFWHQFAMTVHSPVGIKPDLFEVSIIDPETKPFANNDLQHSDPQGTKHSEFSNGLKKALYNYMHGIGFEFKLQEWFDFQVPQTTMPPNIIDFYLRTKHKTPENGRLIWTGNLPDKKELIKKTKKGKKERLLITLNTKDEIIEITSDIETGLFLFDLIKQLTSTQERSILLSEVRKNAENQGIKYNSLINSQVWSELRKHNLLII